MYFSSGRIVYPAASRFNLGSQNWTIEAWVYFATVAANQRVGGGDLPDAAGNYNWAWYTTISGRLDFYLSTNGTSWNGALAAPFGDVSANQWYHVALVRNGGTITPYLNGTAGSSANLGGSSIYSNSSNGPVWGSAGSSYFSGYLDDIRMTNVARYTANFTPPTAAFLDA